MTILDIVQQAFTARVLHRTQEVFISDLLSQKAYDHVDMAFLERLKKALEQGEVIRA